VKVMFCSGGHLVQSSPAKPLMYAGGETRIIAVQQTASFHSLTEQLEVTWDIYRGVDLRYMLPGDEVMVTLKNDQDTRMMFEEWEFWVMSSKEANKRPSSNKLRLFCCEPAETVHTNSSVPAGYHAPQPGVSAPAELSIASGSSSGAGASLVQHVQDAANMDRRESSKGAGSSSSTYQTVGSKQSSKSPNRSSKSPTQRNPSTIRSPPRSAPAHSTTVIRSSHSRRESVQGTGPRAPSTLLSLGLDPPCPPHRAAPPHCRPANTISWRVCDANREAQVAGPQERRRSDPHIPATPPSPIADRRTQQEEETSAAEEAAAAATAALSESMSLQIIRPEELEIHQRLGGCLWGGPPGHVEGTCAAHVSDFCREANLISSLHHPNVVRVFGVVQGQRSPAIVTEYMERSLRNILSRAAHALDGSKRVELALDAARGMEYLHSRKIVHFDLKSANMLVGMGRGFRRPILKVCDFGLAKHKRQTYVTGVDSIRGTLPWTAPEVVSNPEKVDEKVDVFSFGICLWELWTSQIPHADLEATAIIGGLLFRNLRPSVEKTLEDQIPFPHPEWKELMIGCWNEVPSDRPSFVEITERLNQMAKGCRPSRHS
ncbi:hypothetical protein CYMTET_48532, partial [Cymbomonas tetramitiformis]